MINIAILGFGVVGSGVYAVTRENAAHLEEKCGERVVVKRALDIRDFSGHEASEIFCKSFDEILTDSEISIVVETIGGITHAYEYTKAALKAGKNVVTSNKELVSTHGRELVEIAREKGVTYLFEASVGGGIPILHPIKHCLAANQISEVYGIFNGTTNYILSKMAKEKASFDQTLKDAQNKGYAESNPAADVEGIDACRKTHILAWLAFGKTVECEKIPTKGITKITTTDIENAEKQGYVIKLIGRAKISNGEVYASVAPELVPKSHPLALVDGVNNAIVVSGNFVGETMFYGQGAGSRATASAVVSDVLEIIASRNIARKTNQI